MFEMSNICLVFQRGVLEDTEVSIRGGIMTLLESSFG